MCHIDLIGQPLIYFDLMKRDSNLSLTEEEVEISMFVRKNIVDLDILEVNER